MQAQRWYAEAEHSLQTLVTHAPEAVVLLDIQTGRFVEANPVAERLFGFSRSDLIQMNPFALSPPYQPDGPSSERGNRVIEEAAAGGVPVFEWWHRNARGERVPCEVRLVRVRWQDRDVIRGQIVDVSDRKRMELSESGRRRLLECIAHDIGLPETLDMLVRAIEDLLPGMLCSILLLDPDTNRLHIGAAPSLPAFYNAAVEGLQIGPAVGSCGAAAYLRTRVVASDLTTHPNWMPFRHITEQAQLRACWSEPILSFTGSVLGTFAMYYREAGDPAPVELDAIGIAAQLSALAIEHERAQRAIHEMNETLERRVAEQTRKLAETNRELQEAEEDARLSAVAFDTHDSIVITDPNGIILRVNSSFTKLTGYTPDDVIGKTPRVLRSGRHDQYFYRLMWEAIREHGYWQGEVWNRCKGGREYLQRLTITCVKNEKGDITHYVGDGQDITEEKRAAVDRAAIDAARKVQESLFPTVPPRIPGFDIAGAVHPADRASGDFFDFIPMGQDSVGVLIADVSGHGLGPSLLMAQTQAYLRALAECHGRPGDLLTHANRLFSRNDSGHFVTLFLCRLNPWARSFTYAAAGHQAYLVHADGEAQVLSSTSIPLGIDEATTVPDGPTIAIAPGDVLLLLTDGIEEAMSPDRQDYGQQRVLSVVRDHRTKSAIEIMEALFCSAKDFMRGDPQADDITAVVVKRMNDEAARPQDARGALACYLK